MTVAVVARDESPPVPPDADVVEVTARDADPPPLGVVDLIDSVHAAPAVGVAPEAVAAFVPDGLDGFSRVLTSSEVHVVDCRSTCSVIPDGAVQVIVPPEDAFSPEWNVISRSSVPFGVIAGAVRPLSAVFGETCATAPASPEDESQLTIRRIAPTESDESWDTVYEAGSDEATRPHRRTW